MKWKDKNYGKSPFDPDYDDRYDADADKGAYDEACEEREQRKIERNNYGPMFDIPKKANCYDCALHASHKGGFCRSRDVKNPCEQIKWNYQPLGKQSK